MFTTPIQDILTKRLQVMPQIITGKNFRHDWRELVYPHIHSGKLALIDDTDTAIALGDALFRALKDRYECAHITLPRGTTANEEALAEIIERSVKADMLLAIGSGTINDLVKYVAHKAGKPYLLFPTAASMNGYVSANASITIHGHKQSLAASLPKAVIADMSIITQAPIRLAQAGLGDSLARTTAQADWLLAHHLLGVAYDQQLYSIMTGYEEAVFGHARAIASRDPEITHALFALILLSGFGMTIAKSSQPASGGEHMLAHAMEMAAGKSTMLHGEEMAAATLLSTAQWQRILISPGKLAPLVFDEKKMYSLFGDHTISFKPLYDKKCGAIKTAMPDETIPTAKWQAVCEAVSKILIPSDRVASIIQQSGLPSKTSQIGWDEKMLAEILPLTRFTRDRMSWLDLA